MEGDQGDQGDHSGQCLCACSGWQLSLYLPSSSSHSIARVVCGIEQTRKKQRYTSLTLLCARCARLTVACSFSLSLSLSLSRSLSLLLSSLSFQPHSTSSSPH